MMAEKRLEFALREPQGQDQGQEVLPTLIEENGFSIPGAALCLEFVNEAYPDAQLLGDEPYARVEARRLAHYFLFDISKWVTQPLLDEKLYKPLSRIGPANSQVVADAQTLKQDFLEFLTQLYAANNWLAGPSYSVADIAAAAQVSTLDFMNEIAWDNFRDLKRWYARVKSRRAMASVLADKVDGVVTPSHYANPDF